MDYLKISFMVYDFLFFFFPTMFLPSGVYIMMHKILNKKKEISVIGLTRRFITAGASNLFKFFFDGRLFPQRSLQLSLFLRSFLPKQIIKSCLLASN